ncbi:MAG TPA: MFS transporter [Rhizomicrobium sp.]|nr:MFS transporter [Rhizomicrobium sp.]
MTYVDAPGTETRDSHVRFWIIAVLFIVSSINYASRATLGIAGKPLSGEFHLDSVQLGYLFSAFAWAYAIGQIPGGGLLDRYGSRPVYIWSITLWSVFTALQAFVSYFAFLPVMISLFALRFALGFAECPSFPANARIVANWFPKSERGTASAIFNASQYFSVVAFTPLMGWLAQNYGWRSVFLAMGGIGLVGVAIFAAVVQSPARHKRISSSEYAYIENGGALVKMDGPTAAQPIRWSILGQLLSSRMLWGMYVAQYCITALTFFYSTWFFIYLHDARHMSLASAGFAAAVPAIAGFAGGVLGGIFSDWLLKRGTALSPARKIPILAGLVISCAILACNYTDSQMMILIFMSVAFFGKGVAALGWAVMSDVAPREATGLAGSVFNLCGNLSGIFTPIVIGYILKATNNSWDLALVFLFAHSIVAMIGYGLVAGELKRVVLKTV